MTDIQYLESVVEAKGGVGKEVCERIAKASRAFGMLKKPVFRDRNLFLTIKMVVCNAVVLGVLLYGSVNLDHHTQHNQGTGVIPQLMPKRNPGHYI